MESLPCRNCLTLAMCKARHDYLIEKYGDYEIITRNDLMEKCSLLREYYNEVFPSGAPKHSGTIFHKFFIREYPS